MAQKYKRKCEINITTYISFSFVKKIHNIGNSNTSKSKKKKKYLKKDTFLCGCCCCCRLRPVYVFLICAQPHTLPPTLINEQLIPVNY